MSVGDGGGSVFAAPQRLLCSSTHKREKGLVGQVGSQWANRVSPLKKVLSNRSQLKQFKWDGPVSPTLPHLHLQRDKPTILPVEA